MLQVLQDLERGATFLVETPVPAPGPHQVLIRASASVISAGTERMLLEFGRASLLAKARQQPERVVQVLDKARTNGIGPTVSAVRAKLGEPVPLGYCSAGVVEAVGSAIRDLAPGDRVVSNGPHAEFVCVGRNLVAKVPDDVPLIHAAFTPLAAIALQSVRLGRPTLGETWVVTGLGLVGLLAVQLLRASGCRVIGLDFDSSRLELAREFGAEVVELSAGFDPTSAVLALNQGLGIDGAIIAASTSSSDPIHQAAQMCRKRGRIIMVGVTGMELMRGDFFEKELTFQVSCSYGPGRYDADHEQRGVDYPRGFVRWTEGRNFDAILQQLSTGSLSLGPLISHRFPIARADDAYAALSSGTGLGIILEYEDAESVSAPSPSRTVVVHTEPHPGSLRLGVVGAGNFVGRVLLPAFIHAGASPRVLASSGGLSATILARKLGIPEVTTESDRAIRSPDVDAVVIGTPHGSHAGLVKSALSAGKHVFVEKPLATTREDLEALRALVEASSSTPVLTVGMNRRFSPYTTRLRQAIEGRSEPLCAIYTVNAGHIDAGHWTQDPVKGGGRIIGEACHFIDLLRFIVGHPIVHATAAGSQAVGQRHPVDRATLTLSFADGSMGTVHYLSNGHASFSKERVEVFSDGRVFAIDNFRRFWAYDGTVLRRPQLPKQDKGHTGLVEAFISATRTGCLPIPLDELFEVAGVAIDLARALEAGPHSA